MRARLATLILAAGVSLGGCAYGGGMGGLSVGTGYGSPYGYGHGAYGSPYAYGAGYGSPYGSYGYDPFGRYNPYYRSPYYGSPYYGSPYMGWYDGYYYPGRGYYVYDRDRVRRRISDAERRRWLQGIADLAARRARDGQAATSGTTSTQQRAVRTRDSAVSRVRDVARARAEARSSDRTTSRATSRSTRSTPRSSSVTTTIRRRLRDSND